MKKFALLAIAALSFSVISCKEETKVETTETEVTVDSLNAEVDTVITEVPETAADSVENVTVDSAATTTEEVK
ncbi:hypothetical protein [Faecalibacter rhinopitheci]|uniref:Uncharacterized protein n=1 Tax=Faecalibacter rhinopitheci TaxID=2779678 RepID=A0A8J7K4M1_9FLAO|nr:hypothetical protein [Faecalibacter rhinopitheci]MBF0597769.1 hypothetical protein [Faecalibacter rhinopitheci]